MIGVGKWKQTLAYVHRTGLHTDIEALLRPGRSGRPRALQIDVLLAAMIVTFQQGKALTLVNVHETLTVGIPHNVIRGHNIEDLTIRQVRYLWDAIVGRHEYTSAYRADLGNAERAEREFRYNDFLDRLAGAASHHLPGTGRYAADATGVATAARPARRLRRPDGTKLDETCSWDRNARHGYRTETVASATSKLFGYQMEALVRVGELGEDVPRFIEAFRLVPGNNPSPRHTLELLDGITDRIRHTGQGTIPVEIMADRAYSNAVEENWVDELVARGITQVLSIHPKDRGSRPHPDGYLMIDGWPFHPAIPKRLINPKLPKKLTLDPKPDAVDYKAVEQWEEQKAALENFNSVIAEREAYRYVRHTPRSKPGGDERFVCPGKAGSLHCEGCATTNPLYDYDPGANLPFAPMDRDKKLPRACAQKTITVKGSVERKLRQDLPFGTREWQKSFGRRNSVESAFASLKKMSGASIARGWTRQVGRVKTGMLLAIAVAAANLSTLLEWARNRNDTSDPLTTMDTTPGRFVELDRETGAETPFGTDPPQVA